MSTRLRVEVSERKLAETALQQAHDELEERVRERTAELTRANDRLTGEIEDRTQAEERIRASLEEKEVLLQEINHRVKNNLQIISSLLSLQSKDITDVQALRGFKDSQNRVRSMALIHESLYQSDDLASIDLGEYVRTVAISLFRAYEVDTKAIRTKIDVEEVSLGADAAVPCGLIINELLSNCLKHAFPDGRTGEVGLKVRSDGDRSVTLTISDDGVGFPSDVDFRDTDSLGLHLVNILTRQLRGTIQLDVNGGTEFRIHFPRSLAEL